MKYHLFNAEGKILGRLASRVAVILRGKNKVDFAPHRDEGDAVVIINSDKIGFTGSKRHKKIYHRFSGYPGGITSTTLDEQLKKDSRKVLKDAIYGMLSKNKLRKLMMKRLFIYKDDKHPHKIG
ncbi:MAG: 50S ribosomal protein L13 [Candidatus Moranbacteria bacterium]|nr:50S ribosomal protein L13 [Candidatus Moranbacteria bacterium]